jgi:hypothetical protein
MGVLTALLAQSDAMEAEETSSAEANGDDPDDRDGRRLS